MNYDMPVFRPPSEANSLILQITLGCSQNSCTFCGMYKMKKFRIRSLSEIFSEISSLGPEYRQRVKRIFLADGDALIYPQVKLLELLNYLQQSFPSLMRVSAYASPNSLQRKSVEELQALREKSLRILYFGLESGDPETLQLVKKGFTPEEMLDHCQKGHDAGMKLSVTAILGLAGKNRSHEHAISTAEWVNTLSPRYFSLLTLFPGNNEKHYSMISPLTNGEILEEAHTLVKHLNPSGTILRSNHVSNILQLAGSYPKDRVRIIEQAETALKEARSHAGWYNETSEEIGEF